MNTWNARRAAVLSWLAWCAERGFDGPKVPAWAKRLTPPDSETPARLKMAIDRLIARREVHLREKCFCRMLYETVARAEEILPLEHRGPGLRRPPRAREGRRRAAQGPPPRPGPRGFRAGARVLGRRHRPAAAAAAEEPRPRPGVRHSPPPGPGKVVSSRDVCPDSGLARLSYGQARALLDEHTALHGAGTGRDLHEFRHSGLSHLGEQGASLLMLMAESRHKKAENVRRYFKPSPDGIAELTSLLAPGDTRRGGGT